MVLEKLLDLSERGKEYRFAEFCWIRDSADKVLSEVPGVQPQRGNRNLSFGSDLCSRPGYAISCCVILGKSLILREAGKQISMAPDTQLLLNE